MLCGFSSNVDENHHSIASFWLSVYETKTQLAEESERSTFLHIFATDARLYSEQLIRENAARSHGDLGNLLRLDHSCPQLNCNANDSQSKSIKIAARALGPLRYMNPSHVPRRIQVVIAPTSSAKTL